MSFTIYTDGACQGNGKEHNTGGYGIVVLDKDKKLVYIYNKLSENTTNNREELKAILYSFLYYGENINNSDFGKIPVVYSDSAYAVNTFNDWMFSWERNGWRKSNKQTPENLDLIQAYFDWYQKGYRIDLRKVKGHSDNKWNDLADLLATGKITINKALKEYGE